MLPAKMGHESCNHGVMLVYMQCQKTLRVRRAQLLEIIWDKRNIATNSQVSEFYRINIHNSDIFHFNLKRSYSSYIYIYIVHRNANLVEWYIYIHGINNNFPMLDYIYIVDNHWHCCLTWSLPKLLTKFSFEQNWKNFSNQFIKVTYVHFTS